MKLSVTIITLNEEKGLPRCLGSVREVADEIVVVDSGSTDKTVEIAKKFGAKVFTRKFDNYANQKNYATAKTEGEWILSIDADEELSPELQQEIKNVLADSSRFSAYSMPRKNIILGKFIRYARWQPELDRHIWLWRRELGNWRGDVHEEVQVRGSVGKLKHAKVHYQYATVTEFMNMMNSYSSLDKNHENPIYTFLVRYFYRLGFLDGIRGFVLSYLMAIYQVEVWVKCWEKRQ